MRKLKAFTLVELLVVIGIIALLISILLPSLAKARQQAATVQCLSNLRTIGQGIMMYADTNNGLLPYGQTPAGWWSSIIAASLSNSQTTSATDENLARAMAYFRCPEVDPVRGQPFTPGNQYIAHPLAFPDGNNPAIWPYRPVGNVRAPQYRQVWFGRNGYEKAIVFDGTIDNTTAFRMGSCWPIAINLDASQWFSRDFLIDAPAVWPAFLQSQYVTYMEEQAWLLGTFGDMGSNGFNMNFRFRHNGGTACNFLFGDGHAETRMGKRDDANPKGGTSDLKHRNFTLNANYTTLIQP